MVYRRVCFGLVLTALVLLHPCVVDVYVNGFTSTSNGIHYCSSRISLYNKHGNNNNSRNRVQTTPLFSNNNNKPQQDQLITYSRDLLLREEIESPFRKVRYFFYIASIGGCLTSLALSVARILAALSGINEDLLQESLQNAGIDLAVLLLVAVFWKRDYEAQQSRLKRAAKGAEFAKLAIRGSASLLAGDGGDAFLTEDYRRQQTVAALSGSSGTGTTMGDSTSAGKSSNKPITIPLSALRRGRGIEKRVVIVAAGKAKIRTVLQEAAMQQLGPALLESDLIIVPVVLPQATAPLGLEKELLDQSWIALPAGGGNWKAVLDDEAGQAASQGVNVDTDGFCIVLKKNGRVGQRTKGIYLDRMCGEVSQRKDMGLDVANI